MLKRILTLGLVSLTLIGIVSCRKQDKAKKISLEKREALKVKLELPAKKKLRIAVGSMITPRSGFAFYSQLLNYIGEKLDREVEFVDRENYAEIIKLIRLSDIDVAFVCGRPYVDGHDKFELELLVAPQMYGETVYYSYIIVPKDSPAENLEDLRGKSFAFTDLLSNSGKLVPTYILAKRGETPDSCFQKYIYSYAHDKSIKAVAHGIVDGAAVDYLIWEYINHVDPVITSKTKVIEKSRPHGIPPVVVRPDLNPELKERIRQILLNAHKDEKGREILKGMMIDKFIFVYDNAYDSIREMKVWIAKQGGEE